MNRNNDSRIITKAIESMIKMVITEKSDTKTLKHKFQMFKSQYNQHNVSVAHNFIVHEQLSKGYYYQ